MSFLLPDPAELRALAGGIDAAAHATRLRADRLGATLAATGWHGPAARAFLAQAEFVLSALRGSAGRLDDAADAARRHAARVDVLVQTLTGLVRAGLATLPDLLALPSDVLQNIDALGVRGVEAGVRGVEAGVRGVLSTAADVTSTVGDLADSALDCVGLG